MAAKLTAGTRYTLFAARVGIGVMLLLVAMDIIPAADDSIHAPDFILALCGLVFAIAGVMVLCADHPRANDFLAGTLCLSFGLVGGWVSLFSSDDGFSGGIPFVAYETNVKIARVVFGTGALICFTISIWAFRRCFRAIRG